MGTNGIFPKPIVNLHPRVWSAMHAYKHRKGKPDDRDEKGFLLVGTVRQGGMIVDVMDVIIYPQLGDSTAVDFDQRHPLSPKFWPAVQTHLAQNNWLLLGWAHYYSGGVHHSHMDNYTDDFISEMTKDSVPIMVSMTWGDDKAGAEGKLWLQAGDNKVQVTCDDLPINYVVDGQTYANFAEAMKDKIKVKLVASFDGIEYDLAAKDLGLEAAALNIALVADFLAAPESYLGAKEHGPKLQSKLMSVAADPAIVEHIGKELDKLWRSRRVAQTGGGVGPHFSGAPSRKQRRAAAKLAKKTSTTGNAASPVTTADLGAPQVVVDRVRETVRGTTPFWGYKEEVTVVDGEEETEFTVICILTEDDAEDYIAENMQVINECDRLYVVPHDDHAEIVHRIIMDEEIPDVNEWSIVREAHSLGRTYQVQAERSLSSQHRRSQHSSELAEYRAESRGLTLREIAGDPRFNSPGSRAGNF